MLKRFLTIMITITVSLLVVSLAIAEDSPELVYQKYVAAFKSKNLEEIKKYVSKRALEEMNAETPEMQQKMVEMIVGFMPKSYSIAEQIVSQDAKAASLKLVGVDAINDSKIYGSVSFIKEEQGWKIDRESWSNAP